MHPGLREQVGAPQAAELVGLQRGLARECLEERFEGFTCERPDACRVFEVIDEIAGRVLADPALEVRALQHGNVRLQLGNVRLQHRAVGLERAQAGLGRRHELAQDRLRLAKRLLQPPLALRELAKQARHVEELVSEQHRPKLCAKGRIGLDLADYAERVHLLSLPPTPLLPRPGGVIGARVPLCARGALAGAPSRPQPLWYQPRTSTVTWVVPE